MKNADDDEIRVENLLWCSTCSVRALLLGGSLGDYRKPPLCEIVA